MIRPTLRVLAPFGVALLLGCPPEKSPLANDGGPDDNTPPDEALFQEGLALYDAATPDYAGAQVKFDELWDTYPESQRHDNAGYLAGRCRYEQDDFAGAITMLGEMRTTHADSPFAYSAAYFSGRSRFELLAYLEAIPDFQAAQGDPAATYADNAGYFIGRCNYEGGQLAQAITAFETFEAAYPDSTYIDNASYYHGRAYFDQQQYDAAIPVFEQVFATADSIYLDNAHYYIARSHYALAALDTALPEFETVITDYPTSQYVDNSLYYECRVYVDQGQCAEAQTALTRMQTEAPASPELARAQAYVTNGCP